MAVQKLDVPITDLTGNQEAAAQLRVGEQVSILHTEGQAHLQVLNLAGRPIGLITESCDTELLARGSAVVKSIRRQEGTVVQVLLRVTQAPPRPTTDPGPQAEAEEEELTARVTRAQYEALADCEELRAQLKDERLQELIRRIDTAPDREKALKAALQQQPDLAAFADRVLAVVSPEHAPQPRNPTVEAIRELLSQRC